MQIVDLDRTQKEAEENMTDHARIVAEILRDVEERHSDEAHIVDTDAMLQELAERCARSERPEQVSHAASTPKQRELLGALAQMMVNKFHAEYPENTQPGDATRLAMGYLCLLADLSTISSIREPERAPCCMDGKPVRIDPCASCEFAPIQAFRIWLDAYGQKDAYDRGDMAACWYAGKRYVISSEVKKALALNTPSARRATDPEERAFIAAFIEWFERDGSVGGLDSLTENYEGLLESIKPMDRRND